VYLKIFFYIALKIFQYISQFEMTAEKSIYEGISSCSKLRKLLAGGHEKYGKEKEQTMNMEIDNKKWAAYHANKC
jgi:hypothetical protein